MVSVSHSSHAPGSVACVYCDAPADTTDHVIPRAYGGTNDPANLAPACRSCNSRKGTLPAELLDADARTVAAWLRARGWTTVGRKIGAYTSMWESPDPDDITFYSRWAAIRRAAWEPRA
jgi:hypothetical protein